MIKRKRRQLQFGEYKTLPFETANVRDIFSFFDQADYGMLPGELSIFRGQSTFFENKEGYFVESDLRATAMVFQKLLDSNIIQPGMRFCDAGSGDGRIVFLAEAMGLNAFGIDFTNKGSFWKKVFQYQCILQQKEVIRKINHLFRGDFTDEKTYEEADTEFKKVNVFYNFMNGYLDLATKINEESDSGTILLFTGSKDACNDILSHNKNLELVENISVSFFEISTQTESNQIKEYFILRKK